MLEPSTIDRKYSPIAQASLLLNEIAKDVLCFSNLVKLTRLN